MLDTQVRPSVALLTDDDAREKLQSFIIGWAGAVGPKRLGLMLGCDEKTIRRARDGESLLHLNTAFNMLAYNKSALNDLLSHFKVKLVDIDASASLDPLLNSATLTAKLAAALSPESDGRRDITIHEIADMEAELIAQSGVIDGLLSRLRNARGNA